MNVPRRGRIVRAALVVALGAAPMVHVAARMSDVPVRNVGHAAVDGLRIHFGDRVVDVGALPPGGAVTRTFIAWSEIDLALTWGGTASPADYRCPAYIDRLDSGWVEIDVGGAEPEPETRDGLRMSWI